MLCLAPVKRFGCLAGFVILLIFAAKPLSSEQKAKQPGEQQDLPETRDLLASETIPLVAPPPLAVLNGMKCDPDGNIYLVYTDAPQAVLNQRDGVDTLPISKLSLESKTAVQYAIPSIPVYQHLLRYDFEVDGSGKVYALLSAADESGGKDKPRAAYLIVKYKNDGTMDSFFKIGDVPGGKAIPLQFAFFPDGNFLATGTVLTGSAPDSRQYGVFTAVFDRSGTFVTDVKVPDDIEPVPFKVPGSAAAAAEDASAPTTPAGGSQAGGERRPPERGGKSKVSPSIVGQGFTMSAPDGNVYLLRAADPARLSVISPGGSVVRQFQITPPARGSKPTQMAMAGQDKLFIQFGSVASGRPGEDTSAEKLITVLDPNKGEVTAVYRLAAIESSFNLAACASSPYSFLFLGTGENSKLKVVRYSPPGY